MGKYFPDLPARTLGQMGDVKDNPVHLVAEEVYAKWPVGYLWGRNNADSGEHPKGLALDFSGLAYKTPTVGGAMDHAKCQAIADYLWKHRVRLGVWYVIWNRQIISMTYEDEGWRPYTGKSPHTDHVHVSFYPDPVYKPPATEEHMPLTDADVKKILTYKGVPNINEPGGDKVNMGSIAGHLTNIEGTQDAEYRLLRSAAAELGAIRGTLDTLTAAVAAQAAVDPDALVAAVRGAAEAGAIAALQGVVDVRVTVDNRSRDTETE